MHFRDREFRTLFGKTYSYVLSERGNLSLVCVDTAVEVVAEVAAKIERLHGLYANA